MYPTHRSYLDLTETFIEFSVIFCAQIEFSAVGKIESAGTINALRTPEEEENALPEESPTLSSRGGCMLGPLPTVASAVPAVVGGFPVGATAAQMCATRMPKGRGHTKHEPRERE